MRKIIVLLSVFFIFSSTSAAITIGRIKVTGNTHTSTGTILSFLPELQEGHDYSQAELDGIVKRGKERLDITGWFYKADIYVTASKNGPDFRNIVIEVEEGFLYLFGGGSIYGVFGMDDVYGGGESFLLTMGWNAQYIVIGDSFLGRDLFYYIGAGNMPGGYYTASGTNSYTWNDDQNIGSMQQIGLRFNYDFSISLSNSLNYIFSDNYAAVPGIGYDSIDLCAALDTRPDIYTSSHGYYISAVCGYFLPFEIYNPFNRFQIQGETYFSIIPSYDRLVLAFKLNGEYQDNSVQENYLNEDYLKISLAGIDGIRSLNVPDLIGNACIDGHAELRWDFFHASVFSIFNIDFEALTFFDCGEAADSIRDISEDNVQYAFGTGLRVFFREPVYVPVRIEFGWDKYGDMSFFVSVEAPF